MRKAMVLILAIGLFIGLIGLVGCGEKETTVKTPEGDVTVTEDNGEVTIHGDEGDISYEVSDKAPTEKELGAPIYPGAEYVPGSGGTMSGTSEEGEFTTAGADFITKDSFNKVVDWYTDELGEADYLGTGGYEEASWMLGDMEEDLIVVGVTVEDGDVLISIGRMSGTP